MSDHNTDLEWWKTGVVYQIYPRSFQDTTGNGIGDLNGITGRLGYLADTLGVDAIWISPFYPSPMADFGYDVSDYTDVHPMFGTLDDFDLLLAEAHRRGLKVIIDWVPNHTSDQHPWFVESRSSVTNPKRDWYVWRDSKPDGGLPNNWQSEFGGPAWTHDEGTGQWYLHSFLAEQPDLNWRNPAVATAMFDTVRFWLDRGVDGFRIDVAHYVMKDPDLTDNPLAPNPDGMAHFKPMGPFNAWQHVHDRGHPDVHRVYREFGPSSTSTTATVSRRGDSHLRLERVGHVLRRQRRTPHALQLLPRMGRVESDGDPNEGRGTRGRRAHRRLAEPGARQPRRAATRHAVRSRECPRRCGTGPDPSRSTDALLRR